MIERLLRLQVELGTELSKDDYLERFRSEWSGIAPAFVKFERRQEFVEEGNESFDAFQRGDWHAATALAESRKDQIASEVDDAGFPIRRIRAVDVPHSEYLEWELMALRVRAEAGEEIRVLDTEKIADLERDAELPEIVCLGSSCLFIVIYSEAGSLERAVVIDDEKVVARAYEELTELFKSSIPIGEYLAGA